MPRPWVSAGAVGGRRMEGTPRMHAELAARVARAWSPFSCPPLLLFSTAVGHERRGTPNAQCQGEEEEGMASEGSRQVPLFVPAAAALEHGRWARTAGTAGAQCQGEAHSSPRLFSLPAFAFFWHDCFLDLLLPCSFFRIR